MKPEDLSTYPGLNGPIAPVDAGFDILMSNPVVGRAILNSFWGAGPIAVPLPLRLWNSRCLILNGLAKASVMEKELERSVPRFIEKDGKLEPDPRGQAWVQLYGSDYTGTTLGSFKAVFTLTVVKPSENAVSPDILRVKWWKYWGTSLVNKAFKEQVWGIQPNHLAVIDTAYEGRRKAVRLIESGRPALTMVWNSARFTDIVEVPQHSAFKTVARRPTDDGENDVEMEAILLKRESSDNTFFPFAADDDQFVLDSKSEIGQDLKRIGFKPLFWQCMVNYGGVVKIYDDKGSAKPPAKA